MKIPFTTTTKFASLHVTIDELMETSTQRVTKLDCGHAMKLAAEMAERMRLDKISFDHANPPRSYRSKMVARTITLINSSKFMIHPRLIHVGAKSIGINGFVKVEDDFMELLRIVEKKKQKV